MCQTLAEGGRRCAAHSPTGRARRTLVARLDRHVTAGDTAAAFGATEALATFDRARAHYGDIVTPVAIEFPESVHQLFATFQTKGFRPMVVGGSVRDPLNDGRAPEDVDVEVYGATLDQVNRTLRRAGYQINEVGKSFGVVKVTLEDGTDVDVSVPRRDNHVAAGHRGFTIDTDISMTAPEAASRRDFTVNSMGYDPEFGVCVDPYQGRADLKAGLLRHTSDAFSEDPLRVLRGFQFAARFGFPLHPDTTVVCRNLVGRATELPVERVRGEWEKFYLQGRHPAHGLEVLAQTGWDSTTPGLVDVNTPSTRTQVAAAATLATTQHLDDDDRLHLVAATVARGMDDATAQRFMHHTVEGSDNQRGALGLSRARWTGDETDTQVRGWAHTLRSTGTSIGAWARLESVTGDQATAQRVLARARRLGCSDGAQPDLVLGRDIISRFSDRKPGPWTGVVQRQARQAQVDGVIATKEEAQQWLADYRLGDQP